MNKKLKSIPKFRSEADERRFWETRDSSNYMDWNKAERVRLSNLKPSTESISLRLPVTLLERIKVAANKRDVPYQSLIKTWLPKKRERADDCDGLPSDRWPSARCIGRIGDSLMTSSRRSRQVKSDMREILAK